MNVRALLFGGLGLLLSMGVTSYLIGKDMEQIRKNQPAQSQTDNTVPQSPIDQANAAAQQAQERQQLMEQQAQAAQEGDPYAQQQAQTQQPSSTDPYAQQQTQTQPAADPYAQQQTQTAADPYASQPSGDPGYQTSTPQAGF